MLELLVPLVGGLTLGCLLGYVAGRWLGADRARSQEADWESRYRLELRAREQELRSLRGELERRDARIGASGAGPTNHEPWTATAERFDPSSSSVYEELEAEVARPAS
jgi:hypothetical protein